MAGKVGAFGEMPSASASAPVTKQDSAADTPYGTGVTSERTAQVAIVGVGIGAFMASSAPRPAGAVMLAAGAMLMRAARAGIGDSTGRLREASLRLRDGLAGLGSAIVLIVGITLLVRG